MRSSRRLLAGLALMAEATAGIGIGGSAPAAHGAVARAGGAAGGRLLIVENAGQFDPEVRFQVRAAGMTMWATEDSLWLTRLEAAPNPVSVLEPRRGGDGLDAEGLRTPRRGVNLELTFSGRRAAVPLVPSDPLPTRMNYFLGNDPRRWRSGVRTYRAVTWRDLYPGISVSLTEVGGQPALVVETARHADPAALRMRLAGADALRASPDGRLVADTAIGSVALPPVLPGGRLEARVDGKEVSFSGSGGPSSAVPRAPKPSAGRGLKYGTFLGAGEADYAADLARGPDGSMYVTGWTYSPRFPTTPGAFDRTYDGPGGFGGDAFVSRIDPTGSTLAYSTFLGGSTTDVASSIAVNADGAAHVSGGTSSEDFPTTPGAFDTTFAGGDGFVTKLDPQGAALTYSTFLGGTAGDSIEALALAFDGTTYATGQTLSEDFPTTPGAFDRIINDEGVGLYIDGFVTALNPAGSDLVYSTFLGGSRNDYGYAVAVGPEGTAFVTGEANTTFPTTPGSYDESYNGGNGDGFVTEMNGDGSALVFSTYVGGSDTDTARAIAVDGGGNAYLTGSTSSPDYPITPGAYDPTINSYILSDAFATKVNSTGTALVWSTFLGGRGVDLGEDVVAAPDGTVALTGSTLSANFPTTFGAFERTLGGPGDAFVTRFNATGSRLRYSSYLGGTTHGSEAGYAIAPAREGSVAVAGATPSDDFPVTPGAYDTTFNGVTDGFVAALRVVRSSR